MGILFINRTWSSKLQITRRLTSKKLDYNHSHAKTWSLISEVVLKLFIKRCSEKILFRYISSQIRTANLEWLRQKNAVLTLRLERKQIRSMRSTNESHRYNRYRQFTLQVPTPQSDQTNLNNSSAVDNELLECPWPF